MSKKKSIDELPTDKQIFRKIGLTRKEYSDLDTLMKDLYAALQKYGVKNWWLDGGGVLGLIRHGLGSGIPMISWDDDVDIGVYEKDEKNLHKALKSLEKKYEIDWDLETSPECRRVIISSKSKTGFPFAEFFIYVIKNGRTHFRCKEDEDSWGKRCWQKVEELFPLKDYEYGSGKIKGPYSPVPFLNKCYGPDWNTIAYRQQSHKTGKWYDEDRRVKVTNFDHVGSINERNVYDPLESKWIKKGSSRHLELIKKHILSADSRRKLYPGLKAYLPSGGVDFEDNIHVNGFHINIKGNLNGDNDNLLVHILPLLIKKKLGYLVFVNDKLIDKIKNSFESLVQCFNDHGIPVNHLDYNLKLTINNKEFEFSDSIPHLPISAAGTF